MNIRKCKKSGNEINNVVTSMNLFDGKYKEKIGCPYCGEANGTEMTGGFGYTHKIEDDKK